MEDLGVEASPLTKREWDTLAAAQERLLPSAPSSPGARDVNAIGHLAALVATELSREERELVRQGAARLDALARGRDAQTFDGLSSADKDGVLELHDRQTNGRWTRIVLDATLEAFLGDPVHGVNTDEAGWTWLGIRPGTPRPTEREPR